MSRAGCPYDNAPMEKYYNTLKWVLQFLNNGTDVPACGYHTRFKVLHFFLEKFYKPINLHRQAEIAFRMHSRYQLPSRGQSSSLMFLIRKHNKVIVAVPHLQNASTQLSGMAVSLLRNIQHEKYTLAN